MGTIGYVVCILLFKFVFFNLKMLFKHILLIVISAMDVFILLLILIICLFVCLLIYLFIHVFLYFFFKNLIIIYVCVCVSVCVCVFLTRVNWAFPSMVIWLAMLITLETVNYLSAEGHRPLDLSPVSWLVDGARYSSVVECLLMERWVVGSFPHGPQIELFLVSASAP